MPRVIQAGRKGRNSTAKPVLLKPYDRPSTPYAFDEVSTSSYQVEEVKPKDDLRTGSKAKAKATGKGDYNKLHLVSLIIKVSPFFTSLVSDYS